VGNGELIRNQPSVRGSKHNDWNDYPFFYDHSTDDLFTSFSHEVIVPFDKVPYERGHFRYLSPCTKWLKEQFLMLISNKIKMITSFYLYFKWCYSLVSADGSLQFLVQCFQRVQKFNWKTSETVVLDSLRKKKEIYNEFLIYFSLHFFLFASRRQLLYNSTSLLK